MNHSARLLVYGTVIVANALTSWEHVDHFHSQVAFPDGLKKPNCGGEALMLRLEYLANSNVGDNYQNQSWAATQSCIGENKLEFSTKLGFSSLYHFHSACSAFVLAAEYARYPPAIPLGPFPEYEMATASSL